MTLIIEKGDCLKLMKELPDASIDLFICDLPYGETNCGWDSVIDMDKFWEQFRRLRKSKRTACIHFCSTKFGYSLIKSWEAGYKMDMVWKKRNKTGGLQSKHRPMRNHEMVYFFYEQSPKYNRDKYHKRIAVKNETINGAVGNITNAGNPEGASNFSNGKNGKFFEPPNPASVVEETIYGIDKDKAQKSGRKDFKGIGTQNAFEPPNPASVVEEKDGMIKYNSKVNGHIYGKKEHGATYTPPNPASVVEETQGQKKAKDWGYEKCSKSFKNNEKVNNGRRMGANYEPPNPVSVMDEPVSMFESTKVFIGKRHHQTEKPQDILEFFLKYWTDEGDTVLDPTMGSGSTGVACKKLNRNFIGFEKDKNIFKVAESRLK